MELGVDQSTISRELNRNTGYRYQQALRMALDRREASRIPTKMNLGMVGLIESKLAQE